MDDFKIISDKFVEKYKNKKVNWGFNGLGYVVYKRTYSRIKEDGQSEEWPDTIQRCINGAQKIGAQYSKEEAERLFDYIFNFKCSFAGRFLWQLGTKTVDKFGLPSLCNCWFIAIKEPEDFCFLFEHAMLGGGVGYSIEREGIHELPKIKSDVKIIHKCTKDADFIIPDSREGWVEFLRKVLDSFFISGKSFTYSTILVRGKGEPIKTFGGTASGPNHLIEMVNNLQKIFHNREARKLKSIDVLDICNIIGACVVSGNVRRAAQICLGDPDDYLYLRAKNWSLGNIPNWRALSNNTIYADSYEHIIPEVWNNGYEIDETTGKAKGECYGFINIKLARKKGRLKDDLKDTCDGTNPCSEALLESKEPCDLSEIFLNNIESQEEFIDCAKLLYKTNKSTLMLSSISKETEEIVKRNMRIGIGITGICQSLDKIKWLDKSYYELKKFDKEWSKKNGWNESIRLTVVKPSGTISLLSGSCPGVHPAYSRYYFRTIRMSSIDKLVEVCRKAGYHIEYEKNFDGTENHNTVVIYFPCYVDENTIISKDMSAIKQLELIKTIQTEWADQSVSVTVYYKPEELKDIKEWLKNNYSNSIKTVSFLLHEKHGFEQAPYIEITEEKYKESIKNIKQIEKIDIGESLDNLECVNGACPIK